MDYRKLGDLEVSTIGLGTLRTFDVTSEEDIAQRKTIVDKCLDADINFIDSAAAYGHSEEVVGAVIEGLRDKFFLATKVRIEGKAEGEAQIQRSFDALRTDYIDLIQVHNLVDWQTQLPTLHRLKDEGKIGMVGVTVMAHDAYPTVAQIMRDGLVDAVQIPYNVINRLSDQELLPVAEEKGVGVLVMEPLQKGRYVKELNHQPDLAPLAEHGITTWAQALLSWVLSDPRVTMTIPTTSRPERVAENAAAGSITHLPQEVRDYIRQETERCLG